MNSPKIQSGKKLGYEGIAINFCSDWISGYDFLQTNAFLLISATAVAFGQGHRKVIQLNEWFRI